MLLGLHFQHICARQAFFEAYYNPSTNKFLHGKHKSVICVIERNDSLHIFV